jgi:hypothetical protein
MPENHGKFRPGIPRIRTAMGNTLQHGADAFYRVILRYPVVDESCYATHDSL